MDIENVWYILAVIALIVIFMKVYNCGNEKEGFDNVDCSSHSDEVIKLYCMLKNVIGPIRELINGGSTDIEGNIGQSIQTLNDIKLGTITSVLSTDNATTVNYHIDNAIEELETQKSDLSSDSSSIATAFSTFFGHLNSLQEPFYETGIKRTMLRGMRPFSSVAARIINNYDNVTRPDLNTRLTSSNGRARENYSARFKGYFKIPAGNNFRFYFSSDDGFILKIGPQLAVHWPHYAAEDGNRYATINGERKNSFETHGTWYTDLFPSYEIDRYIPVEIGWYNNTGNASFSVTVSLDEGSYQSINSILYHDVTQ